MTSAARTKRYRARKRQGLTVYRVFADEDRLTDLLIDADLLPSHLALDKHAVEVALSLYLQERCKEDLGL
jgi:hypothetical protein